MRVEIAMLLALGACTRSAEVLGRPDRGDAAMRPPDIDLGVGSNVWAGSSHSCALAAGELRCFGKGEFGKLGIGSADDLDRATETPLGGLLYRQVAGGDDHTCALEKNGLVWCWGRNDRGQLGLGDNDDRDRPEHVQRLQVAERIAGEFAHSCAIVVDGTLWCWGENEEGQLGQGDEHPGAPSNVPLRVGDANDWRRVATGQGHTCGIRGPGDLYCWGRNTDHELGLGDVAENQYRVPQRVGSDSDWSELAAGLGHTCATKLNGELYCWGSPGDSALGLGATAQSATPARVGDDADWTIVAAHFFNTCGLRRSGELYCWGRAAEGQLGIGVSDENPRQMPVRVGTEANWTDVAVGQFHVCAQKSDGDVYCTGENVDGQLGLGDRDRRDVLTIAWSRFQ